MTFIQRKVQKQNSKLSIKFVSAYMKADLELHISV